MKFVPPGADLKPVLSPAMICKRSSANGFTLLEILLVVMVVAIGAAAFLPVGLTSVEQARTRSALRQMIALNQYARTRAILDRKPVALVYKSDQVQLLSLPAQRDMEAETMFGVANELDDRAEGNSVTVLETRTLPPFVKIREVDGAEQEEDGYFVIFNENGTSVSQRIDVQDPKGDSTYIRVNGITGEIGIED